TQVNTRLSIQLTSNKRIYGDLKRQAKQDLTKAVAYYASELGVKPKSITLRDTTSRWGSCSSSGALNFSWRIILAPPDVLNYLAAHEVAHLREMNHSDRFWAHVKAICPDMDAQKAWLRAHGQKLHAVTV
ncbi:MAG: M48 family metallopeptidase, partial [Pseudomonadota bacterium]